MATVRQIDPEAKSQATPAIEARGLARSFGDDVDAVREIDLSVARHREPLTHDNQRYG